MKKTDNKSKLNELVEEQYEHEATLAEGNERRKSKRLRVKEQKSKKNNTVLQEGIVLTCFSNNLFEVKLKSRTLIIPLSGRFKNVELSSRAFIVVGDRVLVDVSRDHPIIEEIMERSNTLKRYVFQGNCEIEVPIAANIDQVIIATSYCEPKLNLNLVDRYLCSASLNSLESIICINKVDLVQNWCELETSMKYYKDNNIKVVYVSAISGRGLLELKQILKDKCTLFSGPSGVGKSTMINCLEPDLKLRTNTVSEVTAKGKHTTSYSALLPWSNGGYLIDTPGIKTFGLPVTSKNEIPRVFPGFDQWSHLCKFSDCSHREEGGCRVIQALDEG